MYGQNTLAFPPEIANAPTKNLLKKNTSREKRYLIKKNRKFGFSVEKYYFPHTYSAAIYTDKRFTVLNALRKNLSLKIENREFRLLFQC